jgi:hypothetical protein
MQHLSLILRWRQRRLCAGLVDSRSNVARAGAGAAAAVTVEATPVLLQRVAHRGRLEGG